MRWNPYPLKIMGRWNPPVFRWSLIPAKNAAGESHPVLIPAKSAVGDSHPVWDFKIINTKGVGAGRVGSAKPRVELSIVVKTVAQTGAVASSA